MELNDVINFFDSMASDWDALSDRNEKVISDILDMGGITEGKSVLDVACGTGFLFPDYIKRNVSEITGVDISEEMVKIAERKYKDKGIKVICADASEFMSDEKFDRIMIHNAFPHFLDPDRLISNLSAFLSPGGRLTVAHSLSRKRLNEVHKGSASHVSNMLISEKELSEIMGKWLDVDIAVSDDEKYIVSGKLRT